MNDNFKSVVLPSLMRTYDGKEQESRKEKLTVGMRIWLGHAEKRPCIDESSNGLLANGAGSTYELRYSMAGLDGVSSHGALMLSKYHMRFSKQRVEKTCPHSVAFFVTRISVLVAICC